MAQNLSRRQTLASLALLCATGGRAFAQADQDPDSWPDLVHLFFNDATIVEDQGLVAFEAPRAPRMRRWCPCRFRPDCRKATSGASSS